LIDSSAAEIEIWEPALLRAALNIGDDAETVCVYDGAHGINEMHRYTWPGGKQRPTVFHGGTLGDGMRAAIAEVESSYRTMIEGWEGR
jgi:hypothetical protein